MSSRRRLLVVDDDPDIRDLLAINLSAEGFEVLTSTNGVEAEEVVRSHLPDFVVLDVMMPERDGLEVLTSLKASTETRHIPVVLLTAKATDADIWHGWRSGADYYLAKPFNIEELLYFVNLVEEQAADPRPVEDAHIAGLLEPTQAFSLSRSPAASSAE